MVFKGSKVVCLALPCQLVGLGESSHNILMTFPTLKKYDRLTDRHHDIWVSKSSLGSLGSLGSWGSWGCWVVGLVAEIWV